MSSQKYNKVKGSAWERDLENYLNEMGLDARRLARAGSKDIGDVCIRTKFFDAIGECKNVRNAWAAMKDFLRQAFTEARNYSEKYDKPTIAFVATKTRQSGPGEGRIVMTVDEFINLLRWGGIS